MLSLTRIIFQKELRETLRDRRVLLGVVISPLLLTPCLLAFAGFFGGKKVIEQRSETIAIGYYAEAAFSELATFLAEAENVDLTSYESRSDATAALETGAIRSAVVAPANAALDFRGETSAKIEVLYDQANENSSNAHSRITQLLRTFNKERAEQRLVAFGKDASFIKPIAIESTSIAEKSAVAGLVLSLFLPYIIVLGAAFGGINTAFDLCAGEKERGTMETLLVSPASRTQIVIGKLLTVFVISLIAAVCSLIGIVAALSFGASVVEKLSGETIQLSYLNLALLVPIVSPLALFAAACLLLVSTFARNPKEAQAYIFPFIALFLFPAVLSPIIGAESPLYTAFIPVLNISLVMKQTLGDAIDLSYLAAATASSVAYAAIAVYIATAAFKREGILFRS